MNLGAVIAELKEKTLRESENWHRQMEESRRLSEQQRAMWDSYWPNYFKPAGLREYTKWLKAYLEAGFKPTHYYDYPMPTDQLFLAFEDFEAPGLHGASSVSIIVPIGIKCLNINTGKTGHTELWLHDDFKYSSERFVPVYSDIIF
jgi:hypothetical protein